ncbi:hypothetical protein CS8_098940 [Cupriavidus sp. 8B]
MRVAMDAVVEAGALCEGAICYTGDLFDSTRGKYNIQYYVRIAKELERAGAHVLGIKDMAGVCRPDAARALVTALKQEVGLPIHFHTHDTSGGAVASVLAAIEAGVDAVDGAMDSLSGLTSQPSLGAIAAALQHHERRPEVHHNELEPFCTYWESVRKNYEPFEAQMRAGTSDVYRHEMPGGQYTNLREQARSLGLEASWSEVAQAYADVNVLFGDIVKVTPSSKVVGDMALHLVANQLTADDISDPEKETSVPDSVISMFRGEMGYPADGFPKELQRKILRDAKPIEGRAGAHIPAVDLEAVRSQAEGEVGKPISDNDLASYLMYPKVFKEFCAHREQFDDVSILPTPVFYFGQRVGEEIAVDIEKGKTLFVGLNAQQDVDVDGAVRLYFEVNGQPRPIRVDRQVAGSSSRGARMAEGGNGKHAGAPMQGAVILVAISVGQTVEKGDRLVAIEAMKMETSVVAEVGGVVKSVLVSNGDQVRTGQLLVELE